MKLIDKDEALKSLEIKARSITFGDTFERACLKGVSHSYNAINELPNAFLDKNKFNYYANIFDK